MPTALISVFDKTGLIDFAGRLRSEGWNLLASGGTARVLADAGIPVQAVETVTREPEMLDGRVKTLHPAIHASLLARDTDEDRAALAARGWSPIDMIAVNLYPFEEVIARPRCRHGYGDRKHRHRRGGLIAGRRQEPRAGDSPVRPDRL